MTNICENKIMRKTRNIKQFDEYVRVFYTKVILYSQIEYTYIILFFVDLVLLIILFCLQFCALKQKQKG